MNVLEIDSLHAGYAGTDVLRGISLSVGEGEVVALLGANGAGKSTTILAIAGEIHASSGRTLLLGRSLDGPSWRRARAGVAVVNDDRSLFSRLTVRENLKLGAGAVDQVLEVFPELEKLLDRRAGLLSGGEQQMVSVGRAIAGSPRLLVVDELSLGLAPQVVDRLLTAIHLFARSGAGVLMVEQHARKALSVADQAYVLCRGKVAISGTGLELLDRFDEVGRAYLATSAS